jgi:DNA invertase Pin-like site-specific DNA recombinase
MRPVYTDVASSVRDDRPQLERLLDRLEAGDTVVVWRLDRLGRSLRHLSETVTALQVRGVGVSLLHESIDTTTAGGRAAVYFRVFVALAEFERDLIRDRTVAGLAAAATHGRRGGRPTVMTAARLRQARRMHADQRAGRRDRGGAGHWTGHGVPTPNRAARGSAHRRDARR